MFERMAVKLTLTKEFVLGDNLEPMKTSLKYSVYAGTLRRTSDDVIDKRFTLMWSIINIGTQHPIINWIMDDDAVDIQG